jgi:hypothetical protein
MDNLIIEQYLNEIQLLQEIELISEDMSSFMKTFKIAKVSKIVGTMQDAISKKNHKKIKNIFSKIKTPTVSLDKLKIAGKKMSPDFNKNYTLSKRVLQNSLSDKVKDSEMIDIAALAITAKISAKKSDIKSELKTFILKYRKVSASSSEKNKLKMPPELINEAIIGYLAVGLIFGAIGYGSFVLATFTGVWWAPFAYLIVAFILAWWKKIAEQETGER